MPVPKVSAQKLRSVANQSFSSLVLSEIGRSRKRIAELERTYPSAERDELAQRLVDSKKAMAATSGAISGLFGLLSVPLDMVLVAYLQIALLVDVATLHRVNLKSTRAQGELLDLLAYANGVGGPLLRAGPKLVGRIAIALFQKGGLPTLGRAVPVVAAPVTAWLNNRALARVGREAMIHYGRESKRDRAAG